MAVIALIQKLFPTLNLRNSNGLTDFSKQVYDRFFEILVEESGHTIQRADSLEEYQSKNYPAPPDLVICTPIPEIGNVAPGFEALQAIRDAFGDTPVVVWSNRDEAAIKKAVLEDYKAVRYYMGTLLEAGDDIADMVLEYTRR